MAFAPLNVAFYAHPKIAALTNAEFRMQVSAILYANEHLTDGLIVPVVARMFPGYRPSAIKGLEVAGLWLPNDQGWRLYNFHKWNASAEQVQEVRARRVRAGRAGADSRWNGH